MRLIKRVRPIPVLILLLTTAIFGFCLMPEECCYFQNRTYKCTTHMGSLVTFNLTIDKEGIRGHGVHVYSSGKENHILISGYIDDETGSIFLRERHVASGNLYGKIIGRTSEDFLYFTGEWVNSEGGDNTPLNMEYTEESPEYILKTEGPKTIEIKAAKVARQAKALAKGIYKGLTSN